VIQQILKPILSLSLIYALTQSLVLAGEPNLDGLSQAGQDSQVEDTASKTSASNEDDFQYAPIPDPKQKSGKVRAETAFEAFINDNQNAGLLVPFLKQFDVASLKYLRRKVMGSMDSSNKNSRFWVQMKRIGAEVEALEEARRVLWRPHEKRYNKTFKRLRKLQDSFDELQKSADTGELRKQGDELRITISKLRAAYLKSFRLTIDAIEDELSKNFFNTYEDDYSHLTAWISEKLELLSDLLPNAKSIVVQGPDGSTTERNIFQELDARMHHVISFAKAAGEFSPEKYGLTYVLSWIFTDKNLDLAIQELQTEHREKMEAVGVKPKDFKFYGRYFDTE
jgi:hypothetical protein